VVLVMRLHHTFVGRLLLLAATLWAASHS